MKRTLKELAEAVGGRAIGDANVEVTGVASIAGATRGDLVFAEDAHSLDSALASQAAAVVAGEFAEDSGRAKPLVIAAQPRLAFARAAKYLCLRLDAHSAVHSSAMVDASARLGNGVYISENVVIGAGAEIGEGTKIGAGSVVGANVRAGRNCEIYPHVTIYAGTSLGDRVIVHAGSVLGSDGFGYVRDRSTGRYEKFPQIGRLEIHDDVEIGANSTIDRGALDVTRIGRGTKLDNLVHVGHNCQIGRDVVIAAQTGISGSSVIEDNVVIGGQVGVADHVRIEQGAILGAQSGIPSKKILRGNGVVFWGTPARPLRGYLKELATLARLAKR